MSHSKLTMGLGDVEGTTVSVPDLTAKQTIDVLYSYLGQHKVARDQVAKTLLGRLSVIQAFNQNVTGRDRPVVFFFPTGVALSIFHSRVNGLKFPAKFTPINSQYREMFLGIIKKYTGG